MPYFSLLVSVYNTSAYLEQCLNSLINQNYPQEAFEIIVVNDNSTDDSLTIIQSFASSCPCIRLIDKQCNEGTFLSRIDAMKAARGQYMIIVDSDDWLESNALTQIEAILKKTGTIDILEPGYIAEQTDSSEIIYDHSEGLYDMNKILQEYASRKIYSALWLRVYSRKTILKLLDKIDTYYDRKSYLGVCIEDEYISPLILASAQSYYAAPIAFYHYRAVREGSSMTSIAQDARRKLIHVKTVLHAADRLLEIYPDQPSAFSCFFALQTNNLFYFMGEILNLGCTEEIPSFKKALKKHKRLFFHSFSLLFHPKIIFRSIHLFLKAFCLSLRWKIRL